MADKRRDSGEWYPGGRVMARPDVAPAQVEVNVSWSEIHGKPDFSEIATLGEADTPGTVKQTINTVVNKLKTSVLIICAGMATVCAAVAPQFAALDDIPGNRQIMTNTQEYVEAKVGAVPVAGNYAAVSNAAMSALQPSATNSLITKAEVDLRFETTPSFGDISDLIDRIIAVSRSAMTTNDVCNIVTNKVDEYVMEMEGDYWMVEQTTARFVVSDVVWTSRGDGQYTVTFRANGVAKSIDYPDTVSWSVVCTDRYCYVYFSEAFSSLTVAEMMPALSMPDQWALVFGSTGGYDGEAGGFVHRVGNALGLATTNDLKAIKGELAALSADVSNELYYAGGVLTNVTNAIISTEPLSGDTLLVFTNTAEVGGFTLMRPVSMRVLAVGGGGGGGGTFLSASANQPNGGGGGGGAGGMVDIVYPFDEGVYTVSVGGGGAGGRRLASHPSIGYPGGDGTNSTVSVAGRDVIVAVGGGGGRGEGDGKSGGSGGGGSMYKVSSTNGTAKVGGSGTAGQGYGGGAGDAYNYGGGGGGAGGAGADASASGNGVGGVGRVSDITGANVMYASGGGGGCNNQNVTTPTNGISGGDGSVYGRGGVGTNFVATAGEDCKGGGGGGASRSAGGGKGGDGIVIVRISAYAMTGGPKINGIDSRINGVNDRINGIDNRINGIDNRISTLEVQYATITNLLDGLETALRTINGGN